MRLRRSARARGRCSLLDLVGTYCKNILHAKVALSPWTKVALSPWTKVALSPWTVASLQPRLLSLSSGSVARNYISVAAHADGASVSELRRSVWNNTPVCLL